MAMERDQVPIQGLEEGSQAAFIEVSIATALPRWLVAHAAICHVLHVDELGPLNRRMLDGLVGGLEKVFEGSGLVPPEGGWRTAGYLGDWGVVDGSRPLIQVPMCKTCHVALHVIPVGQTRTVETNEEIYIWVCRRCGNPIGERMDFGLPPVEGRADDGGD